jgi:molybdate transport system substrate-binding protein
MRSQYPGGCGVRTGFFTSLRLVALALALSLAQPLAVHGEERRVVVFAAASLKSVLDEIRTQWQRDPSGALAVISYAGSSALARQIEQGGPADLFLSADLEWMDYLEERNLIRKDTRRNLVGNRLVLVAPRDSDLKLEIASGFPLLEALGAEGRLAVAAAEVPAGKYARAALESLGVLASIESRLAWAENVRAALTLVARGETPLGIVYATDAGAEPAVRVVGTFPEGSHPAIVYAAALTQASTSADAKALLAFFSSAAARASFEKQGFTVLP